MIATLYNYDLFPKVFPVGVPTEITLKPLGAHVALSGAYTVTVHRVDIGDPSDDFNTTKYELTTRDGVLKFTYTAEAECEHFIRFHKDGTCFLQMSVFALGEDLACRVPLRGDLHMHTCRSDGSEDPAVVCANYRRIGYDFIVVTDHHRYYPSLEAISKFEKAQPYLNILPGEEVHLPMTNVHIVNAGGQWSINALLQTDNIGVEDQLIDANRAYPGVTPPERIDMDAYRAEIAGIEASERVRNLPEDVNKTHFAVCLWIFDRIREAGGLGIFCHPYWISNMWQIPQKFTDAMLEMHPFDAFEVLGGENYYEQNGFQTATYYQEYAYGRKHPIVGSTDSHGSTEHNRNRDICSTIVFAHKNERTDILQSIKDGYSVAVDSISKEFRLVGERRLQQYACFLMNNWFPLHDRIAEMDGELMREWYFGEAETEEIAVMKAKAEKLMAKYFRTV